MRCVGWHDRPRQVGWGLCLPDQCVCVFMAGAVGRAGGRAAAELRGCGH